MGPNCERTFDAAEVESFSHPHAKSGQTSLHRVPAGERGVQGNCAGARPSASSS